MQQSMSRHEHIEGFDRSEVVILEKERKIQKCDVQINFHDKANRGKYWSGVASRQMVVASFYLDPWQAHHPASRESRS